MASGAGLTSDELKAGLQRHLKENGSLRSLKTQLRTMVLHDLASSGGHQGVAAPKEAWSAADVDEAHQQGITSIAQQRQQQLDSNMASVGGGLSQRLADDLIEMHLRATQRNYSHSVFVSEVDTTAGGEGVAGTTANEQTESLLHEALGIPEELLYPSNKGGDNKAPTFSPLTYLVKRIVSQTTRKEVNSMAVQTLTDAELRPPSLEHRLALVDSAYALKVNRVNENSALRTEAILKKYKNEEAQRIREEMQSELSRWKNTELITMRAEQEAKYLAALETKTEEYKGSLLAMEHRASLEQRRVEDTTRSLTQQEMILERRTREVVQEKKDSDDLIEKLQAQVSLLRETSRQYAAQGTHYQDLCTDRLHEIERLQMREIKKVDEINNLRGEQLQELRLRDEELSNLKYRLQVTTESQARQGLMFPQQSPASMQTQQVGQPQVKVHLSQPTLATGVEAPVVIPSVAAEHYPGHQPLMGAALGFIPPPIQTSPPHEEVARYNPQSNADTKIPLPAQQYQQQPQQQQVQQQQVQAPPQDVSTRKLNILDPIDVATPAAAPAATTTTTTSFARSPSGGFGRVPSMSKESPTRQPEGLLGLSGSGGRYSLPVSQSVDSLNMSQSGTIVPVKITTPKAADKNANPVPLLDHDEADDDMVVVEGESPVHPRSAAPVLQQQQGPSAEALAAAAEKQKQEDTAAAAKKKADEAAAAATAIALNKEQDDAEAARLKKQQADDDEVAEKKRQADAEAAQKEKDEEAARVKKAADDAAVEAAAKKKADNEAAAAKAKLEADALTKKIEEEAKEAQRVQDERDAVKRKEDEAQKEKERLEEQAAQAEMGYGAVAGALSRTSSDTSSTRSYQSSSSGPNLMRSDSSGYESW